METCPKELDAIADLHSLYTLGKSLKAKFSKWSPSVCSSCMAGVIEINGNGAFNVQLYYECYAILQCYCNTRYPEKTSQYCQAVLLELGDSFDSYFYMCQFCICKTEKMAPYLPKVWLK